MTFAFAAYHQANIKVEDSMESGYVPRVFTGKMAPWHLQCIVKISVLKGSKKNLARTRLFFPHFASFLGLARAQARNAIPVSPKRISS